MPGDSIIQITGLAWRQGPYNCPTGATAPPLIQYTVITVDQPSLTYALALSEDINRNSLAPEIGLTVPINARF